jgi:NDP-sugar pyrophosphorylase family protein
MVVLVYMVGGMSSRFGGIKQLYPVGPNNETLLEMSIKQAIKQPFSKIVFITNKKTEPLFKELFKHTYDNIPIEYIRQQYDTAKRIRPWGTTDAICCLLGHVEEPFILVNSDDIYGEDAFKEGYMYLHTTSKNIIGVSYLKNTICGKGLINRGIVDIQENSDIVVSLKETLGINIETNTNYLDKLCNVNFICLQPFVLKELNKYLVKFKQDNIDNNKIEALLPDDLNRLLVTKYITLHYFVIKDKIISLTYPSDIPTVKKCLI